MIKKLFYLFIFFAPFTSFFALSAWLRLPVIINQLLFITLLITLLKNNRINTNWLVKEDLYLLSFLGLIWLSFFLGFREKRSFNHSLAYTNAILFYFFLTKYIITSFSISSIKIAKTIYWSFLTCSLIILSDFIGKNYYNISLRGAFSKADGIISNMDYYIRYGFLRVGGVAEEPGSMALFYNIYFGVSLYYLYQKDKIKLFKWLFILFALVHFAMLSNAGITLTLVALIIIFLINKLQHKVISKTQLFWIVGIFSLLILSSCFIIFFDIGHSNKFLEDFSNKIFFNESHKSYSSSGQRLLQWQRALVNFFKHPILGNGPGFGVHEDTEGYLSIYLTILSDIGFIAFVFFMGFIKKIIEKVMLLPIHIRNFILFSNITLLFHIFIVADFYHAPIWILFAFVQLIYREQKSIQP
ncbi:O-antigen ligase family protein [Tenacibaculum maritimum]|uniref:O-antigen ligase family protein n=2 Tax=Tenacibaculum maritimum TaxID=107401 RepID=UPI003876119D